MAQFQAGYFIESIKELFNNQTVKTKIAGILEKLSYFDLQTDGDLNRTVNDSIILVVNNMITRGIPTRPSLFIEDILATTFSKTRKNITENQSINYNFTDESFKDHIYRALHIIDPRINLQNQKENLQNTTDAKQKAINDFLQNTVCQNIGEQYIQLFEKNRTYESAFQFVPQLKDDFANYSTLPEYSFLKGNIDILLELPYLQNNKKGLPVEIDFTSTINTDFILNNLKNEIYTKLNWQENLLVKKDDLGNFEVVTRLQDFTYCEYFDLITKNYRSPLYNSADGLDAMQLALTPLGVARIQKTIIEFLLAGKLDLTQSIWNIAVIERDVPCAFLALNDLTQLFNNLFTLEGKGRKFPKIKLNIYRTPEFEKSELNLLYQGLIGGIEEFDSNQNFDLLLDISILLRKDLIVNSIQSNAKNKAVIRSINSIASKRKFYFGDLVNYALKFENTGGEDISDQEVEANFALEYFLKNLFRKQTFLSGQNQILKNILQIKSVVAVSPPASGKSLCYQFAALLQPCICLAVHPVMSLMREQFDNLRNESIDGCVFINSSQRRAFDKRVAKERFQNGEALFAFLSPERLSIPQYRDSLKLMAENGIYFSYFVIDEIHSVSEWSQDFVLNYRNLARTAKNLCKTSNLKELPVIGFTSALTYNAMADVKRELAIGDNDIIITKPETTNFKNFNFEIIDTDNNTLSALSLIDEAKTNILKGKKDCLYQVINDKLYPNGKKISDNATVLYVPNKYGDYGVASPKNNSISDELKSKFSDLKTSTFIGNIDDSIDAVDGTDAQLSLDNYKKFQSGETDFMIASSGFGIGLNMKDLKNVIHFNLPNSIESLYQLTGRAGRDNQNASCTVLYDTQKAKSKEEDLSLNENGLVVTNLIDSEITVDKQLLKELLKKTYKGFHKESVIINELLTKVSFPTELPMETIANLAEKEFGETLTFVTQPATNAYQIHVSKGSKTYGYIDFRNNSINITYSAFAKELSQRILVFVKNEIENRVPQNTDVCTWFESIIKKDDCNGLLSVLKTVREGEKGEFSIGLVNDRIDKIVAKLNDSFPNKFDKNKVEEAVNSAFDSISLFNALETISGIDVEAKNKAMSEEIKKLYLEYRSDFDTFMALSRMSVIKLIDDYTVDYRTRIVTIKFTKNSDFDYVKALSDYIGLYTSKNKAQKVFDDKEVFTGKTTVEKLLNYLITFVYDNIYQHKLNAISHVEMLCLSANEIKDKELFNSKIRQFFDVYFTARYLNPLFGVSLAIDMQNPETFNFRIIENYISEVGNVPEKWKHLKASTDILIKQFPENHIFLLLNAYTQFLLEYTNKESYEAAFNRMNKGLNNMRISEGLIFTELKRRQAFYLSKVYEQVPDLRKMIEPVLNIKTHVSWAVNFNQTFLEGLNRLLK